MAESAKAQDRQWPRSWDHVVILRDTGVPKVREARQNSCKQRVYIDGFDPSSTFIRSDAPPFPPYLGGDAGSISGGEQQGRDQCDAKDVKKSLHRGTRNKEKNHGSRGIASTLSKCAFIEQGLNPAAFRRRSSDSGCQTSGQAACRTP